MKEIQGKLRILHRQKDFDERKSQEIAARAYQEQEIMKLKVIIKTRRMSSFDVAHQKRIRRPFVVMTIPMRPFVLYMGLAH